MEINFSEKMPYEFEVHDSIDSENDEFAEKQRTLVRYDDALRLFGHV